MQNIDVLLTKEELDPLQLDGKVVVVVDLLFTTTTIVAALEAGVSEIWPVENEEAAWAIARQQKVNSFLLAGEKNAENLTGFLGATPLAILAENLMGRRLIYLTTNGTAAIRRARGATKVLAAALGNADAIVRHIVRWHPDLPVLVVCAGSKGRFNLEDFYGAGYLISRFFSLRRDFALNDTAVAAKLLFHTTENLDAVHVLSLGRVGRKLLAGGEQAELKFAAHHNKVEVVPQLVGECVVRV